MRQQGNGRLSKGLWKRRRQRKRQGRPDNGMLAMRGKSLRIRLCCSQENGCHDHALEKLRGFILGGGGGGHRQETWNNMNESYTSGYDKPLKGTTSTKECIHNIGIHGNRTRLHLQGTQEVCIM